jgi:hypothetical protein
MRVVPVIAFAIVACSGGAAERRFALDTHAQSLVGAWDAKLSLKQPYQLEAHDPAAKGICGTIGFVENRYGGARPDLVGNPPHVGVYDMDLSLLGLDWQGEKSFPTAVASAFDGYRGRQRRGPDSVRIVLNPGSQERIVLRGQYDVAGISGVWTAQSSRGTASGSFLLTQHVNARAESRSCSELD